MNISKESNDFEPPNLCIGTISKFFPKQTSHLTKYILNSIVFFMGTLFVLTPFFSPNVLGAENTSDLKAIEDERLADMFERYGFEKDQHISRGELVKILITDQFEQAEIDSCLIKSFDDVDENSDFFKYVCMARRFGVARGFSNGTFRPDKIIDILDGSKIIYKLYNKKAQFGAGINQDDFLKELDERRLLPGSVFCRDQDLRIDQILEIVDRVTNDYSGEDFKKINNLERCTESFISPMLDSSCTNNYYLSRGWSSSHTGMDFVANEAENGMGCWIISSGNGVVEEVEKGGTLGNYIVVRHENGYKTLYAHLADDETIVKAGDEVEVGQRLAKMGDTGNATTVHLHFSLSQSNEDIVNHYYSRINPEKTIDF
ncbi:peptidoglycan DD-metalloendopeptidase family protein [Candidatus Dojkabacteria bacterium]|nr:peptidoglycan DD-metalloendopeptidase family protein [Candidatus Dojkabacteria bacterium]